MRDENRIREKLELSLDSRQLVSLGIGALMVLGVVFVLGVMVGKQVAPAGRAAPTDLLSALDKVADSGSVPLTFQQDLTKPAVTPPAEIPPVKAPVAKAEAHPVDAQVKPAAVPAPSPKMDSKLADAYSAAKGSAQPVVAVPVPTQGFTVQVAASQQKDDAAAVLTKLRSSGLRPYLIDAEIPGKGHWYRVRLGNFSSKDEAEKYVRDLKRETGFTAFVTSAK
jgi:DedD protein